jgi:16S rRNA (uracil1498-N3)-methyltransferase
VFDGSDAHKIVSVLRLKSGDALQVIDSAGESFSASIQVEGRSVVATLQSVIARAAIPLLKVSVAQSIPKGQKMDFVIEKLTELGACAILPLQSERTVVSHVSAPKLQRWKRLAKTAAQQCGRNDIPDIGEPITFEELLRRFADYDRVLLPWELARRSGLRDRLPALLKMARSVLVVIGPEGGFSHAEAQAAQRSGAQLVSLGPRILRTETAGLVALAIIGYSMGDA